MTFLYYHSIMTPFGGLSSIFDVFSGDREEKEIEQLANTTGVVCDRVARVARGCSEEESGDNNLAQVKTSARWKINKRSG